MGVNRGLIFVVKEAIVNCLAEVDKKTQKNLYPVSYPHLKSPL